MLSRRPREQGDVMLKILVSPAGQPARIELARSSGSERLDRAARDAVGNRRFVPARGGASGRWRPGCWCRPYSNCEETEKWKQARHSDSPTFGRSPTR